MQVWWNWQTRWTQNPVVVIPCGFDSHHLHQNKRRRQKASFLFWYNQRESNPERAKNERKSCRWQVLPFFVAQTGTASSAERSSSSADCKAICLPPHKDDNFDRVIVFLFLNREFCIVGNCFCVYRWATANMFLENPAKVIFV